jgi:hypothetical protein
MAGFFHIVYMGSDDTIFRSTDQPRISVCPRLFKSHFTYNFNFGMFIVDVSEVNLPWRGKTK